MTGNIPSGTATLKSLGKAHPTSRRPAITNFLKILSALIVIAGMCFRCEASGTHEIIQNFDFNDAAGTTLPEAENSIADGVRFATPLPGYSTTGSALEISAGETSETFSSNSTPLDYGTGIYRLDISLSWKVVENGADQTFHFSLMDDNINKTTADISVEFRSGRSTVTVKGRAFGGGSGTGAYTGFSLIESGVDLRTVVDFDSGTLETFYRTAGSSSEFQSTGPSGRVSPRRHGHWIRLRSTGDWSQPDEHIRIEKLSVTRLSAPVEPEFPKSYARKTPRQLCPVVHSLATLYCLP